MVLNLYANKNKLYRTLDYLTRIDSILIFQKTVLDYLTRDTLNFNFSENVLRLVSSNLCMIFLSFQDALLHEQKVKTKT